MALIAGSAAFYLVTNPTLLPSTGHGSGYQCWRNACDCSDLRTRAQSQAAYQACGGLKNDVHRLDRNRDDQAGACADPQSVGDMCRTSTR